MIQHKLSPMFQSITLKFLYEQCRLLREGRRPKKESDQIIVNQVKSFKLLERLVRKA